MSLLKTCLGALRHNYILFGCCCRYPFVPDNNDKKDVVDEGDRDMMLLVVVRCVVQKQDPVKRERKRARGENRIEKNTRAAFSLSTYLFSLCNTLCLSACASEMRAFHKEERFSAPFLSEGYTRACNL